jgi:membrane protein implicated in regulation of membrane protease activity
MEATVFHLTPAIWIIAGLVLAALEMVVPGLIIIWFGIAAVVTGILAIFVHNEYAQFGVFVVLSAVMVVFSQKIAHKITKPEPEPVGANRMTGSAGIVTQAIKPPELGRVKVVGDEWRAEARQQIESGRQVRVLAVDGTRLIVEPLEGSSK